MLVLVTVMVVGAAIQKLLKGVGSQLICSQRLYQGQKLLEEVQAVAMQ